MEWDNEVVSWWGAETLRRYAVFRPSHILDDKKCTIVDQDHVKKPVANNRPLRPLDHARQDAQAGWRAVVRIVHKHFHIRALHPIRWWRVDGFLNIRAIEVYRGTCWCIVEISGKAQRIVEQRASCRDLVDVETGVLPSGRL